MKDGRATHPPYVAVVGGSQASAAEERAAAHIGRGLAEKGAIVICGGRTGVMEAVARAARAAGGVVVGLLPGRSRLEGNPYLTVALPTGLGEARNALVVLAADVVVAIGGGYGTLSEVALARKMGKPVLVVEGSGLARRLADWANDLAVVSPEEAVEAALRLARRS